MRREAEMDLSTHSLARELRRRLLEGIEGLGMDLLMSMGFGEGEIRPCSYGAAWEVNAERRTGLANFGLELPR